MGQTLDPWIESTSLPGNSAESQVPTSSGVNYSPQGMDFAPKDPQVKPMAQKRSHTRPVWDCQTAEFHGQGWCQGGLVSNPKLAMFFGESGGFN